MLPRWSHWTLRLIVSLFIGFGIVATFVSIPKFADGYAIARTAKRSDATATISGVVESFEVAPGQQVVQGQPLLRLRSADEDAALVEVRQRLNTDLVRMLADPSDRLARQAVAASRSAADLLAFKAAERVIRAPTSGVIGDFRVKLGEQVIPGETVASVQQTGSTFELIAFFPAEYRAELRQDQWIQLEFAGAPGEHYSLQVARVQDALAGAEEVSRIAGAHLVGQPGQMSAVVHAAIPRGLRHSDGRELTLFDGSSAVAKVTLRWERLITLFVPGTGTLQK